MSTDDLFVSFLIAEDKERERLLLDPRWSGGFSKRLGDRAFRELKILAERRQRRAEHLDHLRSNDRPGLIFIPGVMGSLLHAKIGAGVWWIDAARARDKIDKIGLDPNGEDPSDERLHVEPFCLDLSYEGFLFAAYANGFRSVKHPYDWRKSLRKSADGLARHVEHVWQSNGNRPVHLVAHSMGGLLIRTTLMEYYARIAEKVGRIVFLGTPHYGSPVLALYLREHFRGSWAMWLLGKYLSRTTFRTLRGPLELLPAPVGIYPDTRAHGLDHPCVNFDPYKASDWKLDLTSLQETDLQRILDDAAALYRDLFTFHGTMDAVLRRGMAVIAGVGYETPFRVEIQPGLVRRAKTELIVDRDRQNKHREGDGSVPVASASLEGVTEIRFIRAEHGALPNIPAVFDDVFRFLKREPMQLSSDPIAALEGHLSANEMTSLTPHLDSSFAVQVSRWRIPEPLAVELDELEKALDQGTFPECERVRLL
jgi:pimeloyl-ACP methyl ester carboxylesterase